MNYLTRIVAVCFLAQIGLSRLLWFSDGRTFPAAPFFGNTTLGFPGTGFLQGGLLVAALVAVLVFSSKKWVLSTLLGVLALLILLDMSRLQVWVWFYALVFGALACREKLGEETVFASLRWVLAGIYFWSGFNKIGPYYAEDVHPWFCGAFAWARFLADQKWGAWLAAAAEMSLAFGLIWSRSRPVFRWLAVVFHAYIILSLSPVGLAWNYVVIPWNVAMGATAWFVFGRQGMSTNDLKIAQSPSAARLIVALACAAPALNLAGLWPENMSWKMYSGDNPEATFFFANDLKTNIPDVVRGKIFGETEKRLILDDWTLQEMSVGTVGSERYFRRIGRTLCGCVEDPDKAGIYLLTTNRWDKSKEQMRRVHCRELLGSGAK